MTSFLLTSCLAQFAEKTTITSKTQNNVSQKKKYIKVLESVTSPTYTGKSVSQAHFLKENSFSDHYVHRPVLRVSLC